MLHAPAFVTECMCVSVFVLKIYQSCDVLKKEMEGGEGGEQ